jgi:predicted outer membrane protein
MTRLSKLRGTEFDREYIKAMVDDHQSAVDDLEGRVDSTASLKDQITNRDKADSQVVPEKSNNAPKESVNTWAADVLPTVRHHLDEAKRLDDELDNISRNSTARNDSKETRPTVRRAAPNHK